MDEVNPIDVPAIRQRFLLLFFYIVFYFFIGSSVRVIHDIGLTVCPI